MKRKVLPWVLAAEAVLCMAVSAITVSEPEVFSSIMAFPFQQLGLVLRALSLLGGAGNLASLVLFALLSLLPVGALLLIRRRRELAGEDYILILCAPLLCFVLYMMVNPHKIVALIGGGYFAGTEILRFGRALLGGAFYSLLAAWAVLRLLRLFFSSGTEKLYAFLRALLVLLGVLFVYVIFGDGFSALVGDWGDAAAKNTGRPGTVGITRLFLALGWLVESLPYALDVVVMFAALNLLENLAADRYSRETVACAQSLSRFCAWSLAASVLSIALFNWLQVLFARRLAVINGTLSLPVLSVAFVLAILVLSRFLGENKALKDDNDLFI